MSGPTLTRAQKERAVAEMARRLESSAQLLPTLEQPMPDTLTFTATSDHDGALRRWDLSGPAGVVRFEIADAAGFRTQSIYLHDIRPAEGFDRENCEVCGGGSHDAAATGYAWDLRERWEAAGCDEAVIRAELERWYRTELATGAES